MNLPLLFTYGTLQDPQVQKYVFGRILEGQADQLPSYKWFQNAVYGRYPLVRPTNNPNDFVDGMVYELKNEDLRICDVYETAAYTRKQIILASGKEAWVYVENSG